MHKMGEIITFFHGKIHEKKVLATVILEKNCSSECFELNLVGPNSYRMLFKSTNNQDVSVIRNGINK